MKQKNNYQIPFISQYSETLPKNWQWRSCGIAALKTLMDYYHARDKKNQTADLKTLLDTGLKLGAYIKGVGWSHAGLVNIAKEFGCDGYNRDLSEKSQHLAFKALEEELALRPVIASVKSRFDPKAKDGHLVVITKVDGKNIYLNDSEEKSATDGIKKIPKAKFLAAFKQRLILIRPIFATKLERIQNSKVNLFESYLAQIRGSIGTNMFKHLYLKIDNKNVDVMENGGAACSSYVSNILYLWGLAKDSHAKTEHTLKDMEESGWFKIKRPKVGCIIAWENSSVQRRYPHIGFYVGNDKAISNDSDKTGVPVPHHYTYGTKNNNPKRKIVALYWHKALD